MQTNDDVIEVFFQEGREEAPFSDIVFSIAEAQDAVLGFYNDWIQQEGLNHGKNLENYEDVLRFRHNYPDLAVRAWFSGEEPPLDSQPSQSASIQPGEKPSATAMADMQEEVILDNFYKHLHLLLKGMGIDLPQYQVTELCTQAMAFSLEDEAHFQPERHPATPSKPSKPHQIYLVSVGQDHMALYFDAKFVDAARTDWQEDFQVVEESAMLLSEKYKSPVQRYYFTTMEPDWTWNQVEQVLRNLGVFASEHLSLLQMLQQAQQITSPQLQIRHWQLDHQALDSYAYEGKLDEVLLTLEIVEDDEVIPISLTTHDIVRAVHPEANRWVCADIYATELVIERRKTPRYFG